MKYLIGIDIGTSATKTVMIDQAGRIAAQASEEYPLYQPQNGWAEQDPNHWRHAVLSTLKAVVKQSGVSPEMIEGIGLSGQMHGLVMLDEAGEVLGRSIIWCDQRSSGEVEDMLALLPMERWLEITANPPIAAWTAAKVLWVKKHQPEQWNRCRHLMLPKDYIRYVLTGIFATDVSDASGMQMLDVRHRCWSKEVLEKLELPLPMLGQVVESQEVTGTLLPDIAAQCGLSTRTVVVAGAADNAAAAIGTGVVSEGEAFTSIGTSALVYTHLDHYRQIPEGSLHLCCCAVPGCWFAMGGPQAAGLSLEWFKDNFCENYEAQAVTEGKDSYAKINEEVELIRPGSERLIYLPYLMGERTPHMNPKCRGAFVGLNTIHGRAHLLRAIMEGISYSLADCNDILKNLGCVVREMKACGGGSKSRVWRQIMADVYDLRITTLTQEEGPAYGAAILAGVGAGVFVSVREACKRLIQTGGTIQPEGKSRDIYVKYHALYDKLYEHMKEDFNELYELD